MIHLKTLALKAAVTLVAVGSLTSLGAGAAGAASTNPTPGHHLRHVTGNERKRLCSREASRLAFSVRAQQRFAAQTAVYAGLEARAKKAGNTALTKYWASVVAHRNAHLAKAQASLSSRTTRDVKAHGLVNGTCH